MYRISGHIWAIFKACRILFLASPALLLLLPPPHAMVAKRNFQGNTFRNEKKLLETFVPERSSKL
jgi:hypothetical protein